MELLFMTMDSEGTEEVDEWLDMAGLMTVVVFRPGLYPDVATIAPGVGELVPEDKLLVHKSPAGMTVSGVIDMLKLAV
jgi:hypothetical protein